MNTSCVRLVPLLLAFWLVTSDAAAAQGLSTLLYSLFDPGTNAQSGANQGRSVAIDGNVAVVGAPYDDVGAIDAGVVKVYNATTGALLHTLGNPSPARTELFGNAVAISGSRVVVGAPYDTTGQTQAGSAYIYDLTSATPTVPVSTLTNPSPAYYDLFGWSVAISGTRVVVGARWDDTGAGDTGSAYVYDLARAIPTVPLLTLTNPSPAASDVFGISAAISDTRLVVGARYNNTKTNNAGRAYVYDLASATPIVPVATLTNSSFASGDNVAYSVAISGMRVVVGAHRDCPGTICAGNAYVYDLASLTPGAIVATFTNFNPPFPELSDQFAYSLAISGSRVIVGAPGASTGASGAGNAYVYDLASTVPTVPTAVLNHPSPILADSFGSSVAISGTRMVVGTPLDDTGEQDAGIAYVYDLAGPTPGRPAFTLTNPSPAFAACFGHSVAISGTRVVAGSDRDASGTANAGIVYVLDLLSTTPTVPVFTLTNPSPVFNGYFGRSIAISGTRIVVGAAQDDALVVNAGSAYVFDLASATPSVPVVTLNNPDAQEEDAFGFSVAISGTRVVVGAPNDDTRVVNSGSAYVFDLVSATPTVPVTTLNNPSPQEGDAFGSSVAISGNWVLIGAEFGNNGAVDAGSVSVYDLASATPAVRVASLNNPTPVARDYFGHSVAISGTRVAVGAYFDDTGARDTGSVYVYDLVSATPTLAVAVLNNPNPSVEGQFGFSVAIEGTTVVAGAPSDDTNAPDRGAAYIFGIGPTLRIAPTAPGFARISWTPATSPGFVLQYTDSFSPANWLNAPSGAANPVAIPITNASRFYRLFQP